MQAEWTRGLLYGAMARRTPLSFAQRRTQRILRWLFACKAAWARDAAHGARRRRTKMRALCPSGTAGGARTRSRDHVRPPEKRSIPYVGVRLWPCGKENQMAEATLTSKGQITIPQSVREKLGLSSGDRVQFVEVAPGEFSLK